MQNCIDGIGVACPYFCAYIWSKEVPAQMSEPCVCFGCDCVRNTALERKWSPPISGAVNASAMRTSVFETIVRCWRYGSSDDNALSARS